MDSSVDSMDDSIAQSVKRRKRPEINYKEFDSKLFYDSVVDQIADKYEKSGEEEAVIDVNNLDVIHGKELLEQRVPTDLGYFAENTLEVLRKKCFRNKDLISRPLLVSTPKPMNRSKDPIVANRTSVKSVCNRRTTVGQKANPMSNSTTAQSKRCAKKVRQSATQLAKTEVRIQSKGELSEDSVQSNALALMDRNHPLVKYENQKLWTNNDYQIDCLKKSLEMLKQHSTGPLTAQLKAKAKETIGVPVLLSGSNITPIIRFNLNREPSFQFFFDSLDSPLHIQQVLPQIDYQIIGLSKLIYDCIQLSAV